MHTGTQGKSSDFRGAWARPTCWSHRVSWGGQGGCGSPWRHGCWWQRYPVSVHLYELLLEVDILPGSLAPKPGPIQQHVGCSAGTPQAKKPTGEEHSPTHQQRSCPQPPLDMDLPTRGQRPSLTHQGANTRTEQSYSLWNLVCQHMSEPTLDQLVPGPWVTRGACTAGTHRTFPTEGHICKVEKRN